MFGITSKKPTLPKPSKKPKAKTSDAEGIQPEVEATGTVPTEPVGADISPKANVPASLRERLNKTSFKLEKRPAGPSKPKRYFGEKIIVLVGDEGTVLVHVKKGKVISRAFSPTPEAPETETLSEIARNAPRVPTYVYFDTVDQTYIPQTLPPVTALSVNKLITRRLERDFSDEYIKGAINQGREKDGRKDWLFMMAALQRTLIVNAWIEVVTQWPNRCSGIFMLPIETMEIDKRLQSKLYPAPKKDDPVKPPEWQIFVSYNKVSGIRQAIYHKDKLVLTRLGQPAVDATAETIAGTIEQEIIGTKEYLKRLSYHEKDGLGLIVVTWQQISTCIDIAKIRADRTDILTPHRASEMLGLEGAAQATDRFGDSFLCAALATNKKRILTLSINELKKQQSMAAAMQAQRLIAVAGAAILLWNAATTLWDVYTIGDQLSQLQQDKEARQRELELVKKKSTRSPEELERIAGMVDIYEAITKDAFGPEIMMQKIGDALAGKARAESFTWEAREYKQGEQPPPVPGKPAVAGPQADSSITLNFEGAVAADRKLLQQETTEILNQLKGKFPSYDVKYISLPSIVSDSERIDVNLSQQSATPQTDSTKAAQAQQAKLSLIGPVDNGEEPANVPGQ